MEIGTNTDFDALFAATLDWWRDAGVENAFVDEPTSWFPPVSEDGDDTHHKGRRGRPSPNLPLKIEEGEAPPTPPTSLPDTLEEFQQWWMNNSELDGGTSSGRVPPRGPASPAIMIIAATPEIGDRDVLLSGPGGSTVNAAMALAGIDETQVYRASALPRVSPGADWSAANTRRTAEVLLHHITLVKPARILVIGFNILPLLGHNSPQGPAVLSEFNHDMAAIPMLAVRRFPAQASQPRWKKVLWQAWLEWTA